MSISTAREQIVNHSALEVDNLVVRIGGVVAVNDVSLRARLGAITGLIGPNGAGKSTLINACTGQRQIQGGTIRFKGHAIDGISAAARARRGLGRTFQQIVLIDSATVLENVAFGPEALHAGRSPLRQLIPRRGERAQSKERAWDALATCGLQDIASQQVAFLSTGQRRLVEMARAIASGFDFLLLDEPSSGLDIQETLRFGSILASAVEESGVGILLVEHDMSLVRRLCTELYVLDFGLLIAEGPAHEVLGSDTVRSAYLGHL